MQHESNNSRQACRRGRLGWVLGLTFVLALVMGAGPGINLVNPAAENAAEAVYFGIPRLYLWGLFWYGVQLAVVVTAYYKLWKFEDEAGA